MPLQQTMPSPSHKVSGAVSRGHVHRGSLPTFQRGVPFCVVNPEVIFVVPVQISLTTKKGPLPMLPPRVVVRLPSIQSTGYPLMTAGRTSTEFGVTTSEFAAIGLPHQTIVTLACLGNTPTS